MNDHIAARRTDVNGRVVNGKHLMELNPKDIARTLRENDTFYDQSKK